jgi:hypothetical protein
LGKALNRFQCTAAYIYAMCDKSRRHCLDGVVMVVVAAAAVAVVVLDL